MNNRYLFQGELPFRLRHALWSGRCILFVASGLSAQVRRSNGKPLPTWGSLLNELLDLAEREQQPLISLAEVRELIKRSKFLEAGQEIRDQLKGELQRYFHEIFGDPEVKPSANHKLFPKMRLSGAITSNYDQLVEGAYTLAQEGRLPYVFTQVDYNALSPCPLRNGSFFILKAHGDYQRISTIVLGTRDYKDLMYTAPGYRHFLERIFSDYTLLFVGYGGDDPDFKIVIDKLSSFHHEGFDPHYIVLPKDKLTLLEKNNLLRDHHLRVIEYSPESDHEELERILLEAVANSLFRVNDAKRRGLRVLVSKPESDHRAVGQLCSFLENQGHSFSLVVDRVVLSEKDFQDVRVKTAIADCVIPFLSKNRSQHMLALVQAARANNKDVFPMLLEGAVLPRALRSLPGYRIPENFSYCDFGQLGDMLAGIENQLQDSVLSN